MAGSAIHSLASLTIGGVEQSLAEGSTCDPTTIMRESVTGDSTVCYSEKRKTAKMTANIFVKGDTQIIPFQEMRSVNLVFTCINTGQTYSMPKAWVTTVGEVSNNGIIAVEFEGNSCIEILNPISSIATAGGQVLGG